MSYSFIEKTHTCTYVVNGQQLQGSYRQYSGVYATDPFGNSHFFAISLNGPCDPNQTTPVTGSAYATDGSGYYESLSCLWGGCTGTIYDPTGRYATGYVEKDPDGNSQQYSYVFTENSSTYTETYTYTDALGETALTAVLNGTFSTTPLPWVWNLSWNNANGQSKASITYSPLYVGYSTPCGNYTSGSGIYYSITGMALADGSSLSIGYEQSSATNPNGGPCYTGRISSVSIPTGATISYVYTGANNTDGTPNTMTRTTPDGTWKYVHTWVSSTATSTTAVTDPAGNETDYTFVGYLSRGYETLRKVYQGSATSGVLLETVQTCYDGNFSSCTTTIPTFPFSQKDVYTSFNGGPSNLVETKFDAFGNMTEVKAYDFGASMPPTGQTPLSDTLIYYGQSWNGTACTAYPSGTYISNTPCYSHTENSSGADVAKTQITYSNTGHPTTTKKWTGGSSWLTSTATYNSNGTPNVVTDVNGNTTYTYAYNGTDGCNNLLPTSVTIKGTNLPSGGLVSTTEWNCNGGVVTETLDPNNQPTTYAYNDPLWRLTSMTDALGHATTYSYTPTTFESTLNFNGTTSTQDKLVTTDGLGRPIYAQTRQGPNSSNFDSTQTIYGWTNGQGAFSKVSMPYAGTQAQSAPAGTAFTTTQNDALGRPTTITDGAGGTTSYQYNQNDVLQSVGPSPQTFQRQLQYDAMGRITWVCEINSLPGGGSCSQNTAATGFSSLYSYDPLGNIVTAYQNQQPGAIGGEQVRSFTYDGLSRLTSETNPESGTKTYVYDTSTTGCGVGQMYYYGDLVTSTDAAGNCVFYFHDGLHRLTDVGTNNQGLSHCRRFRYDNSAGYTGSTKPSGLVNTMGRLIEAATDYCTSTSDALMTDEWFSYDPDGRPLDYYQYSTNSGGYYHVSNGPNYYANGQFDALNFYNSAGTALMPKMTYGIDGEGRMFSIIASSGQSPVTGVTYVSSANQTTCGATPAGPVGALAQVTLGSGDSDCYQYQTTTGRISQYTFNIGSQSAEGKLSWSLNGTLQQLAITDPFNTLDSQTCSYIYDALGRIGSPNSNTPSVSCSNSSGTNVWGQAFTYDAFGNITKSVPSGDTGISWQPTYNNPINNQYLTGWDSVGYDPNGNLDIGESSCVFDGWFQRGRHRLFACS